MVDAMRRDDFLRWLRVRELKNGGLKKKYLVLYERRQKHTSSFTLQTILAFLPVVADRGFNIRLIPVFSGAAIDLPIVEWIENVELVCGCFFN